MNKEERKEISEKAAREGDINAIIKQLQDEETPDKVQARDKNLLKRSFEYENGEDGIGHEPLFKYNLDFAGLMRNMSYIIKKYNERKNEIPLR